jgi:hypothetical protein
MRCVSCRREYLASEMNGIIPAERLTRRFIGARASFEQCQDYGDRTPGQRQHKGLGE